MVVVVLLVVFGVCLPTNQHRQRERGACIALATDRGVVPAWDATGACVHGHRVQFTADDP